MQRNEQTMYAEIDFGRCILQAATITIQCIANAVIKNNWPLKMVILLFCGCVVLTIAIH